MRTFWVGDPFGFWLVSMSKYYPFQCHLEFRKYKVISRMIEYGDLSSSEILGTRMKLWLGALSQEKSASRLTVFWSRKGNFGQQMFQNFELIFFHDHLTRWYEFLVHNAFAGVKYVERWSSCLIFVFNCFLAVETFLIPFENICFDKQSPPHIFCNISYVVVVVVPSFHEI